MKEINDKVENPEPSNVVDNPDNFKKGSEVENLCNEKTNNWEDGDAHRLKEYDELAYEDFLNKHSGKYETVLWSGETDGTSGPTGKEGERRAREICDRHNEMFPDEKPWKTNEMLLGEAGMYDMDNPASGDNVDWESASAMTASKAEGDLHVVLGEDGRYNSVYNNVESAVIHDNDKVNWKIDIIDPSSGQSIDRPFDKEDMPQSTPKDDGYS